MDPDFLKQFLPSGFSLSNNWLKLLVWAATPCAAFLVSRLGMPPELAKWFVAGFFAQGAVTVYAIAHAQAARLAAASEVSTTPAVQAAIAQAPAAKTDAPPPKPTQQIVQITAANLRALLVNAAAEALAQHKAATVASTDTLAGEPAK